MRTDHKVIYHPFEQGYRPAGVEWGEPKYPLWARAAIVIGLPAIVWIILGAAGVALWSLLS